MDSHPSQHPNQFVTVRRQGQARSLRSLWSATQGNDTYCQANDKSIACNYPKLFDNDKMTGFFPKTFLSFVFF